MNYTVDELKDICLKHIKWINNDDSGVRADLSGADLYGADLSGADLSRANLLRADLSGADLSGADLSGADMSGADLSVADLSRANLSRADLSGANLYGADLSRANLSGADLSGADLYGADLSGADLSRANLLRANLSRANLLRADLSGADLYGADMYGADMYGAYIYGAENAKLAVAMTLIVPQGDLIVWKKCRCDLNKTCIVKLLIPKEAKRSNATSRKCRAEFADVLEIEGYEKAYSSIDIDTEYIVGKRMFPDSFDGNRWNECSNGIHFFITREEAEAYEL